MTFMCCRFEFQEILIRASFGKYITPKILDDSSDSVKKLLEEKLLRNLPQEAQLNPNDFRRDRFYTREMEGVLKLNWDLLNATFKLYKAKDKTKYFWIEHWVTLLEAIGLMGSHTGKKSTIKGRPIHALNRQPVPNPELKLKLYTTTIHVQG